MTQALRGSKGTSADRVPFQLKQVESSASAGSPWISVRRSKARTWMQALGQQSACRFCSSILRWTTYAIACQGERRAGARTDCSSTLRMTVRDRFLHTAGRDGPTESSHTVGQDATKNLAMLSFRYAESLDFRRVPRPPPSFYGAFSRRQGCGKFALNFAGMAGNTDAFLDLAGLGSLVTALVSVVNTDLS